MFFKTLSDLVRSPRTRECQMLSHQQVPANHFARVPRGPTRMYDVDRPNRVRADACPVAITLGNMSAESGFFISPDKARTKVCQSAIPKGWNWPRIPFHRVGMRLFARAAS